jgi:hypothetical protein
MVAHSRVHVRKNLLQTAVAHHPRLALWWRLLRTLLTQSTNGFDKMEVAVATRLGRLPAVTDSRKLRSIAARNEMRQPQ